MHPSSNHEVCHHTDDVTQASYHASKPNHKLCHHTDGVTQASYHASKPNHKLRHHTDGVTQASPSDWDCKITADIARTFPSHPFFAEQDGVGQQTLFNVIKAYVYPIPNPTPNPNPTLTLTLNRQTTCIAA
jgi:hypothetical protein